MIQSIRNYCEDLLRHTEEISAERKVLLNQISVYISAKISSRKTVNLIYVCTHNSRRSHFGQVWAHVAADFFQIENVNTFSGGTEATAFNINAVNALKRIGFEIEKENKEINPVYSVYHDRSKKPSLCFSKVYNDIKNPDKEFAAIMTCGDAEENCPYIPGAELRIATTYSDPKAFDNTPQQDEKYSERCRQIAMETFYVFLLTANILNNQKH